MTNGVTPRRWLFQANPLLTGLIDELLGRRVPSADKPHSADRDTDYVPPLDLSHIHLLREHARDPRAHELWRAVRRANKMR